MFKIYDAHLFIIYSNSFHIFCNSIYIQKQSYIFRWRIFTMNSKVLLSVILLLHLLILTCHQTSGIFYCDTVEDKFISNNDFYNTIPYNNTINSSPLPIGNTLVSLDVDNNFNYFVGMLSMIASAMSGLPARTALTALSSWALT